MDDLKHVKSEILNNQSYFPAYFNNSKKFVVKEFEQSQKSVLVDILDEMIPTSQIEKDLSVVEIQWKYNGKFIYTKCFVSEDEGILYDNLLYFLYTSYSHTKEIPITLKTNTRFKLPASGETTIPIKWELETISDSGYNLYGMMVWSYTINCSVSGTKSGTIKSITDKEMSAHSQHLIGFSCEAGVNSKSFLTGVNGHLDYAWGYGYGLAFTASATWNGVGFSVSGSGYSATGEGYVSPSELE